MLVWDQSKHLECYSAPRIRYVMFIEQKSFRVRCLSVTVLELLLLSKLIKKISLTINFGSEFCESGLIVSVESMRSFVVSYWPT